MVGGREDRHVGADLGDDVLRGAGLDPAQRAQQLNGGLERAQLLLDRVGQPLDLLIEEVQVRQDRADQQRPAGVEAALERLLELRDLLAQLAPGQLGQDLRVGRARAERVEHVPADLPRMSVATQSSLILDGLSALCSRLASRWRSLICAAR